MPTHPLLPIREVPKNLEYTPIPDSPPWLIGDWRGLSDAFSLADADASAWHHALAGQGRPWLVIRRIFSVAAMWGEFSSPEDVEKWTWAKLSESLGVPESHLKNDLSAAVDFWKKARVAANVVRAPSTARPREAAPEPSALAVAAADPVVNPLDGLPNFQIHDELTDAQIAALLNPLRFNTVRSRGDRLYVANRIIELRSLLLNKNTRESARQLIIMELNMTTHETTLHVLKGRLEGIERNHEIDSKQSAEVRSIADSIASTEKALTALSKTYLAASSELGAEEREAGEIQRVVLGTISHLTEAHRQYYASGDRVLIDGMFAADELIWLTTPLTLRPAQYRPDVVLRIREACIPENLWGADYQPTVVQREACRRLARIVQLLTEEEESETIPGIDDVVDQAGDDEDNPDSVVAEIVSSPLQGSSSPSYPLPPSLDPEPCMAIL